VRILVVEDDRKVARFVRQGLCEEGHAVEIAKDGAEALDFAFTEPAYDLIVLDVMLPGQDGFGVLKTLRAHKIAVPVLMLTARDSVTDKVAGLDLGADDYLTKPFAFEEFLARVRALLRRRDADRAPVLRIDDLAVDPATRRAAAVRASRVLPAQRRPRAHPPHDRAARVGARVRRREQRHRRVRRLSATEDRA
jgi:two-component system, OmpR family, copper resistance phosphate regulon response regulator CusR